MPSLSETAKPFNLSCSFLAVYTSSVSSKTLQNRFPFNCSNKPINPPIGAFWEWKFIAKVFGMVCFPIWNHSSPPPSKDPIIVRGRVGIGIIGPFQSKSLRKISRVLELCTMVLGELIPMLKVSPMTGTCTCNRFILYWCCTKKTCHYKHEGTK